jgi:CBS domain-containing protein
LARAERRALRRASVSSIGEKSGQPTWSSRPRSTFESTVPSQPGRARQAATIKVAPVYDYVAGKADWGSAGLPLEGANGSDTRAGAYLRTDVPTCHLDDRLHTVCEQLDESGWDTCFVVDEKRVVLGRIGQRAIRGREDVSAEQAMTPGPSTIRPSARLANVVERMRRPNLTNLPVTRLDGRLVGLLVLRDAEDAMRPLGLAPPAREAAHNATWLDERGSLPWAACIRGGGCGWRVRSAISVIWPCTSTIRRSRSSRTTALSG